MFKGKNELDEMLLKNLGNHYDKIITIEKRYDDPVIEDYRASVISIKLIHSLARNRNIDISDMQEYEDNDLFYRFDGKVR